MDQIDTDDVEEGPINDEAFERRYQNDHSWELLEEDEHGRLKLDATEAHRAKRRRMMAASASACIRKGMIRYLELVLDLSTAACAQDFRPSRLAAVVNMAKSFIREFFDQNPLSQLGIIIIRNGMAERLTDLSGSPESQIAKLSASLEASGQASIQNALDLACTLLEAIPPYGHKEVLMIYSALSTCDPGNIFQSIAKCQKQKLRVSVVGVAAEVYICKKISEDTGGSYGVALNESHLQELIMAHAAPPPVTGTRLTAELVLMGFPQRSSEEACTATYVGHSVALRTGGYTCPRCKARVEELPCSCHVCGLTLISSPHLARSYHHLFPVKPFAEVQLRNPADQMDVDRQGGAGSRASEGGEVCFGCLKDFWQGEGVGDSEVVAVQCELCRQLFCFECDVYIHDSLHNCPGCLCDTEDKG